MSDFKGEKKNNLNGISCLHPLNKSLQYCMGFGQPDGWELRQHYNRLVELLSAPWTLVQECKMSSSRYHGPQRSVGTESLNVCFHLGGCKVTLK